MTTLLLREPLDLMVLALPTLLTLALTPTLTAPAVTVLEPEVLEEPLAVLEDLEATPTSLDLLAVTLAVTTPFLTALMALTALPV